jgi:hypothetical protein
MAASPPHSPTPIPVLTDQTELFAEMTECYFGSNDFHPCAGALKQSEPELFALLADIWGPLPGFGEP